MPELLPCVPGSPEWLAARRACVTATDIVTILGLSSWDSPYSLYWRKMGQVPETPDNDRFRLSRELESYVIERWANTGTNWKDFVRWPGGLYRHSGRAWQMATPDRILGPFDDLTPEISLPVGVLEVKTWADADRHSWGLPGSIYTGRIGDDGEHLDPRPPLSPSDRGSIPAAVRAQVLWQMDVMGVAVGHVGVVFLPSGEFRSYTIEHETSLSDDIRPDFEPACEICADQLLMRNAGAKFMARLRLELPPPDPDSSAATLAAVRARFTRQPDKTAEINPNIWWAFEQARDDLDAAKAEAHLWEINVREQAGEASVLCVDGQPVARRIVGDSPVKAHTRHSDYLRRIKTEADSE